MKGNNFNDKNEEWYVFFMAVLAVMLFYSNHSAIYHHYMYIHVYYYKPTWELVKNPAPKTFTGRTQTDTNRDGQGKLSRSTSLLVKKIPTYPNFSHGVL